MTHYDDNKWADFVRGLVPDKDRIAMAAHLETACPRCRRVVRLLGAAAEVGASEVGWDVPELAVHTARAIFALQRPEGVHILPRGLAKMIYDSFRDPLPAGVRVHDRLSRQALYQTGRYSVDVRLEYERGTARVTLLGQIADRQGPAGDLGDVPVRLMSNKTVIARARSNQFGEFQMEYEPKQHLWLSIPLGHRGKGKRGRVRPKAGQ